MKTASFSFVAKFPSKKVTDCFSKPDFAKTHKATKLFGKVGILKADKKMIVRTVALDAKAASPAVAIITFTEVDAGKSTSVDVSISNVPESKADEVKGYGKIISADITTFLTPKPVVKKVAAPKKAAGKKLAAKKAAAPKKAAAKKPAAKKVAAPKKAAAKKPAAKKAAAKPAVVKPAAEKTIVPPKF